MRKLCLAALICAAAVCLCSPRRAQAETAQEVANLAAVQGMFDNFAQGNLAAVFALFADDIVSTVYGSEDRIALHGTRTGKAAVEQWFADVAAAFSPEDFAVEEYFADGDTVIALMHESGTALPTGKHYDEHEVLFLTFAEGKVVRMRALDDSGQEMWALAP
jgi:ketosteroid isomerase-like protein